MNNASDIPDETRLWRRQFFYLFLLTALVGLLQAVAGVLLWLQASSPVLLAFGMDAFVGATRELVLARRIAQGGAADVTLDSDRLFFGIVAVGYVLVGLVAFAVGVAQLWQGTQPAPTLVGVGLAAISMLVIPIIGSYMKALAMELRSPALKEAAVFTFGNSYMSMVLLIGLLINAGMERWWADPLGAIVMSPFIIQKGVQIFLDKEGPES